MIALRTGQILASNTLDHATGTPPLEVPSEAELRTWAMQTLARPVTDLLHPVIVWVPDELGSVVRDVLVRNGYLALRPRRGIGGAWQRFSRAS